MTITFWIWLNTKYNFKTRHFVHLLKKIVSKLKKIIQLNFGRAKSIVHVSPVNQYSNGWCTVPFCKEGRWLRLLRRGWDDSKGYVQGDWYKILVSFRKNDRIIRLFYKHINLIGCYGNLLTNLKCTYNKSCICEINFLLNDLCEW